VIATIQYEFVDWRERKAASDILTDLRGALHGMPGIEVEVSVPDAGPPQGKPIQVELSADNPDQASTMPRATVADYLRTQPGDDRPVGRPAAALDRLGAESRPHRSREIRHRPGIPSARWCSLVTTGLKLSDYRPAAPDDAVDIRLRLPEDRRTLSMLDQLRMETPQGAVPLSNFVTPRAGPQPRHAEARRRTRTIIVSANLVEGVQDAASSRPRSPRRSRAWTCRRTSAGSWAARTRKAQEAAAFLGKAFGVAIFLIFALLLAQFNRFTYVFLVLSAVVMSTVGVLLGL
jgi:multidrug efflux pump